MLEVKLKHYLKQYGKPPQVTWCWTQAQQWLWLLQVV